MRQSLNRDGILNKLDQRIINEEIDYTFEGKTYALDFIGNSQYPLPNKYNVLQYKLTNTRGKNWINYKTIFDSFQGNEKAIIDYLLAILMRETPKADLTEDQKYYANIFGALLISAEVLRARQSLAVAVMCLIMANFFSKSAERFSLWLYVVHRYRYGSNFSLFKH